MLHRFVCLCNLPVVTRLEPSRCNQELAGTTVIPVAIVGLYVGLAWKVEFIQAGVTSVSIFHI